MSLQSDCRPSAPALETPRLILQPLGIGDAKAIQREFPHWEIVRLMASVIPWPYPEDGAASYIREIVLPAAARGEAWHWSLRRKSAPEELIGVISLMDGEDINRGFWLARGWQRKGLMTEACNCVTDYWFNVLGKPILRSPKAIENLASRRISQSSGMRISKTLDMPFVCGIRPTEIWEITQKEWRARQKL